MEELELQILARQFRFIANLSRRLDNETPLVRLRNKWRFFFKKFLCNYFQSGQLNGHSQ